MAGSVNKVILVGNLGRDPEIRRTQDGRPIANLSVATSENWRDKATGERREKTEWHRVVIFNEGLCKIVEQYLKKGAKVYLEGALQTRKYTDKDGVEKYSTEVVLQGFNSALTMLDGRAAAAVAARISARTAVRTSVRPARRRARASRQPPAPAASATWTTTFRSDDFRFSSARVPGAAQHDNDALQTRDPGFLEVTGVPAQRCTTACCTASGTRSLGEAS